MPELPEVEVITRQLATNLVGKNILFAEKYRDKIRCFIPENICRAIKGQNVKSVKRKAKYILISLSNDLCLIFHLGMSGRISFASEPYILLKHDHFTIKFNDHKMLIYNDPRRFGIIDLCKNDAINRHKLFQNLGAEPLENSFDDNYLFKKFANKKVPIKIAIMDSRVVVGVGNIYASESLFKSGISPLTASKDVPKHKLSSLVAAIKETLRDAIENGGSTLRDYIDSGGKKGNFQNKFCVYGRVGHDCVRCSGKIERIVQAGRSSFYCPSCQVAPL